MSSATVTFEGTAFHVRDAGSGQCVLFVHGFPLDGSMWQFQIERLQNRQRVIIPDLRGFGLSGVTSGSVSMRQYADDVAAILDQLRVNEPIVLCGLSMGGYIAFQFFQHHRHRVNALVLCDTRSAADSSEVRANRHAVAERVLEDGPEFLAETMPEKLFSEATRQQRPGIVTTTQEVMRRTDPLGIAAASLGMAERPDVTEILPRIDVPTLLFVGEEDTITPPSEMQEMAQAIPEARLVTVPEAGHMAPLERPQAVNAELETFLASL